MMTITLQVVVSLGLVAAVVYWMWRLPVREGAYYGWAPPMALTSAWAGLIALAASLLVNFVVLPDVWVTVMFLVLDPLAIGAGVLTLWIYRGDRTFKETVTMQRVQAKVGVTMGLIAVAAGYAYVMAHKAPFTAVGG